MKRLCMICIGVLCGLIMMAQDALPYPKDTIDGQVYYRYAVERGIGLYRISKNFGVSQEAILQANPSVQQGGLRYGEEILVPIAGVKKAKEEPVRKSSLRIVRPPKKPLIKQSLDTSTTELAHDSIAIDSLVQKDGCLRLAMMLPLYVDAVRRDKSMDRFYDFYSGALIAIYEKQASGQAIELHTYDVGKTTHAISALLNDSLFPKVDAIIGPAYSQQVDIAAKHTQEDSIWMLVPFLSKVDAVYSNPYLLKFNPSSQKEAEVLAAYLAERKDSVNCVVIEYKEDENIPKSVKELHKALKTYRIPSTSTSITQILADSLEGSFLPDKENIIIFNTEKYNNLRPVMENLLRAYSDYRITLYSHYAWQDEKIILPQIYTTIFKNDMDDTRSYRALYERYFNHELSSTQPRYDLLGYDLTSHLLEMMQDIKMHGDSIGTYKLTHEGIQSSIHYEAYPGGGYENETIYVIRK